MQPLTFACPKCGRRMGVGLELAGKKVRCPHCRQVVVAPTNSPSKVGTLLTQDPPTVNSSRQTPPEAFPPSTENEHPLPKFSAPPQEGAESIFGEAGEDDESVFDSRANRKPLLPDLPSEPEFVTQQPTGMINFNATDREHERMPPTDAIESGEVQRPILGPPTPLIRKEISQPDFELLPKQEFVPTPAELPQPIPAPAPSRPALASETVDPWARISRPPTLQTSQAKSRPEASTARPRRDRWFWILLGYAALVTVLAIWGWLRTGKHPFAAIPDLFGQYPPAERKKVSALPIDRTMAIPEHLRVKLGQRLVVGDLEVEPLTIEQRKTKWEVAGDAGRDREIECLQLMIRLRNRSQTVAMYPVDPAFNRYATPESAPLTGIVMGSQKFLGGPIPWPFLHSGIEYITGQEQDDTPLEPGQERTTVIPAIDGEKGRMLGNLIRATKGPFLWQVQLRCGLETYQGQEVSVTALIGVEFDSGQIKR